MTLAGTRPPTVDEWEKYELHHRARLAINDWFIFGKSLYILQIGSSKSNGRECIAAAWFNKFCKLFDAYICNSRPRRFGKSYAANMLAAYYSKGADSGQMFSGLKISKDADFRKHLNKYDVLHIDIQWFLANCEDADKVVSFITKSVLDELRDIYPEVLSQDVVTFPDALSRVKECTG